MCLRELVTADAPFIFELLNDPDWLRYIGDRGVHDLPAAQRYIAEGPCAMYAREGFGLWLVEARDGGASLGLCGLLRREGLDDVDLGFAFLAAHRRCGYAFEAATGVLEYAREVLKISRVVAIALPSNGPSRRLLERLGLRFSRLHRLPGETQDVALYTQ